MHILSIILILLAVWWIAFSLLVVRDQMQQARLRASEPEPESATPRELIPTPRFPTWRECLSRPSLFFIIPFVVVLHTGVFILIWPSMLIHRIFRPELYKSHDHSA